jgi:hypothetical protein
MPLLAYFVTIGTLLGLLLFGGSHLLESRSAQVATAPITARAETAKAKPKPEMGRRSAPEVLVENPPAQVATAHAAELPPEPRPTLVVNAEPVPLPRARPAIAEMAPRKAKNTRIKTAKRTTTRSQHARPQHRDAPRYAPQEYDTPRESYAFAPFEAFVPRTFDAR